jgi:hypothetical protein
MKIPPRLVSRFVSLVGCFWATICPAAEPGAASNAAAQIFENKNNGFRLELPKGWTAVTDEIPADTSGGMRQYWQNFIAAKDVTLTINNKRSDLSIKTTGTYGPGRGGGVGGGITYPPQLSPEKIMEQLQPGEISLRIRVELYGGDSQTISETRAYPDQAIGDKPKFLDTVGKDWPLFLSANPIKPTTTPELSRLEFSFHKRGKLWSVTGFLREPVSAEDRTNFVSMLKSLQFADSPVANFAWAGSLAATQLPESIRKANDALYPRLDRRRYEVPLNRTEAWEKTSDGFLVAFTLRVVPPALAASYKAGDTWKFLVTEDGKVTLQSGPTGGAPAATSEGAAPAAAKPGN